MIKFIPQELSSVHQYYYRKPFQQLVYDQEPVHLPREISVIVKDDEFSACKTLIDCAL